MASKIEIINAAFILLGQRTVNNLNNNSDDSVKKALALYDIYYKSCLTYSYWRFALRQSELSPLTNFETLDNYSYAFQLPNDYYSLYAIQPASKYKIIGTTLYSNISGGLSIFYCAYVSEEYLPEYYVEFFVEKMAAVLAMPITQDTEIAQLWANSADIKLDRALALDSQSQSSEVWQGNPLLSAKFSYYSGNSGIGGL